MNILEKLKLPQTAWGGSRGHIIEFTTGEDNQDAERKSVGTRTAAAAASARIMEQKDTKEVPLNTVACIPS